MDATDAWLDDVKRWYFHGEAPEWAALQRDIAPAHSHPLHQPMPPRASTPHNASARNSACVNAAMRASGEGACTTDSSASPSTNPASQGMDSGGPAVTGPSSCNSRASRSAGCASH